MVNNWSKPTNHRI